MGCMASHGMAWWSDGNEKARKMAAKRPTKPSTAEPRALTTRPRISRTRSSANQPPRTSRKRELSCAIMLVLSLLSRKNWLPLGIAVLISHHPSCHFDPRLRLTPTQEHSQLPGPPGLVLRRSANATSYTSRLFRHSNFVGPLANYHASLLEPFFKPIFASTMARVTLRSLRQQLRRCFFRSGPPTVFLAEGRIMGNSDGR